MGFSAQGLVMVYRTLGKDIVGVEVGVCRGENIKQLIEACPNIRMLYGIDPWKTYDRAPAGKQRRDWVPQSECEAWRERAHELLKANIEDGTVKLIRMRSVEAVDKFPDLSLDFVFIDGNHAYAEVVKDLAAWWPKVRPGGVLSGHDFRPKDVEVRQAVYEFGAAMCKEVHEVDEVKCVLEPAWYIRRA
jgi:hypothetical protein